MLTWYKVSTEEMLAAIAIIIIVVIIIINSSSITLKLVTVLILIYVDLVSSSQDGTMVIPVLMHVTSQIENRDGAGAWWRPHWISCPSAPRVLVVTLPCTDHHCQPRPLCKTEARL